MRSTVKKHSINIHRHKTSVSLEDAFWNWIKHSARVEGLSLSQFITVYIDTPERDNSNLSSAIRLYVLECVKRQAGC